MTSLCHNETKIAQTNGKVVKTDTGVIASLPESREITFNCGNRREKQEVMGVILIQLPTECNTRLGTKTYYGNTFKQTFKIPEINLQVSENDLLKYTTSTTARTSIPTTLNRTDHTVNTAGWRQDLLLIILLITISAITTVLIVHRIYKRKNIERKKTETTLKNLLA